MFYKKCVGDGGTGNAVGLRKVRYLELFSGIGGLRLGFELACKDAGISAECVGAAEIDKHAVATYRRHWPDTPQFGDITALASSGDIPDFDVALAGFCCQAFSKAGLKLGFEDARGTLFFSLAAILKAKKPKAFLFENVEHLVHHDKGRTLKRILEILEQLGYRVSWKVLNSRNFGVPQNRERIFLVGFREGGDAFQFPEPTDSSKTLTDILEASPVDPIYYLSERSLAGARDRKRRNEAAGKGFGYRILQPDGVANTLVCGGSGLEGNLVVDDRIAEFPVLPRRATPLNREGIRHLTPLEFERLQGLPDGFTAGQADGRRYHQLANAVTVPVVQAISRNLLEALTGAGPAVCQPADVSSGEGAVVRVDPAGVASGAPPTHAAQGVAAAVTAVVCGAASRSGAPSHIGTPRVISLFTGCGGMDLGFEGGFDVPAECVNAALHPDWIERDHGNGWVRLRPTGFRTVLACDIRESARRIWVRNFAKRGHSPGEFVLRSVVDLVKAHRRGEFTFPEAEVVTGGFSCQDFSTAGKRAGFRSGVDHLGRPMAADSPADECRGMLYHRMREVIGIVRPLVFVAENVDGLRSVGDALSVISSDFAAIGYTVSARTLYAPEHGVPQTRKRIVFIGLRTDAVVGDIADPYPALTHGSPVIFEDGRRPCVTSGTALRGLPEPADSADPSQRSLSNAKYLAGGYQGQIEVPLGRPGPTIRADHHGQIEFRRLSIEHGGRHADEIAAGLPERRLTVRECARLQTFPDDFELVVEGSGDERVPKTAAYLGVGNAVPPLLAYGIAMRLLEVWPVAFGSGAARTADAGVASSGARSAQCSCQCSISLRPRDFCTSVRMCASCVAHVTKAPCGDTVSVNPCIWV